MTMNSLKMMFSLCFISLFFSSFSKEKCIKDKAYIDYVNPYMGNISHLLVPTYPTVQLPNSMLRVNPERADYTSDMVRGLPIAVTSHRGSSAFNLSPISSSKEISPVINYSYDLEKITPYNYSIYLDEEDIEVKYAPSYQAGVYALNFGQNSDNALIVNTRNGELEVKQNSVTGYQIIDNTPTKIYLYLEIDQNSSKNGILKGNKFNKDLKKGSTVVLYYNNHNDINLRYGISFISVEQARKNLERDIKTYDVDVIAVKGRDIWNQTLSKIAIKGGTDEQKEVFYTSLYRTYERMINISEDGRYYSAFDGKVHNDNGSPFYTDDWIWDTYRATHPLRIIIEPKMELDMINSYLTMANQSVNGWMPTFPEITGDSHRMNGNHAVAVIWDAYCKGLTGFNLEKAYNACKSAMTEKSLLPWTRIPLTELDIFYNEQGFFPALNIGEKESCSGVHPFERRQSVAVMLGHCYDNWCLAQIAETLNKPDDYKRFMKISYTYRNVYNSETGFFHPKNSDGEFIKPFDYRYSGGQGARDYYCENNAWTYRWDVQHNVADLVELMGGHDKFISNLNQTFREPIGKGKHDFYSHMPDHTGNVGQFCMANEPSLHIPYLYNYAGEPWMTQKRIHTLINQWFRSDLMGVPGDEDGGGMSAFVVFSMMGFYPVTPGSPTYNIGSPMFENSKMNLGDGKYFEIIAKNYSPEHKYIQSATLNGKEWNKPWFTHDDIKNGAKLILKMGRKANREWGASLDNVPPSA